MFIRLAEEDDVQELAALARHTYRDAFGRSMTPSDLDAHLRLFLSDARFEEMIDQDTFLLAEENGQLIGFLQFGDLDQPDKDEPNSVVIELRRLFVLDRHQGEGIGGQLMDAMLVHENMPKGADILLDVWSENLGAHRFYERFGFTKIGERPFAVASGAETSADYVMKRVGV